MWLKDNGMAVGTCWSPAVAERLLDERLGGLEMSDTMKLSDEYTGELPGKLALVYEAWRAGRKLYDPDDSKGSLFSKSAFYRYRSQLLPFGIDIAHVRPREVVTENQYIMGAPLKSFLQPGGGAPVPDWAKGTDLYIA
jgi:II/X family phage/plasmid replication protein